MKTKSKKAGATKGSAKRTGGRPLTKPSAKPAPGPLPEGWRKWWNRWGANWLPVAGLAAILGVMSAWLWGRTGEIALDWGNELYVAWQLSSGRVLYRDVASIYGPLSANINALVMRLFGPGLDSILFANLLVLIGVTALLYAILRAMAGMLAAFAATAFFLFVFALSSQTPIDNYNFLTPYAHEMTHGFLLCLGTIWCVDWFYRRGSIKAVAGGGLLTGLAFLTKPEMFLGCAATLCLGLAGAMWVRRERRVVWVVSAAFIGIAVPVGWAFLAYWTEMPAGMALSSISGGWQYVNKPFVTHSPFYGQILGTDDLRYSLWRVVIYAGLYAAAVAVVASFALMAPRVFPKRRTGIASGEADRANLGTIIRGVIAGLLPGVAIAWAIIFAGNRYYSFWSDLARGLPVVAVVALIATGARLMRARGEGARRVVLGWTVAVLALTLLAKTFLNVRVYQYGFVLTAPCAMLAVVALMRTLPAWVARHGGSALAVRIGALGMLLPSVYVGLDLTGGGFLYHMIPAPLAFGGTTYITPDDESSAVAIKWLAHTRGTFAVLPDAGGLNYALGRVNPVPYTVLNPMMFDIYGESNVVAAFQKTPPNFILEIRFDESALGPRWFGKDYGLQLARWIRDHYRPIQVLDKKSARPIMVWKYVGLENAVPSAD